VKVIAFILRSQELRDGFVNTFIPKKERKGT